MCVVMLVCQIACVCVCVCVKESEYEKVCLSLDLCVCVRRSCGLCVENSRLFVSHDANYGL